MVLIQTSKFIPYAVSLWSETHTNQKYIINNFLHNSDTSESSVLVIQVTRWRCVLDCRVRGTFDIIKKDKGRWRTSLRNSSRKSPVLQFLLLLCLFPIVGLYVLFIGLFVCLSVVVTLFWCCWVVILFDFSPWLQHGHPSGISDTLSRWDPYTQGPKFGSLQHDKW